MIGCGDSSHPVDADCLGTPKIQKFLQGNRGRTEVSVYETGVEPKFLLVQKFLR